MFRTASRWDSICLIHKNRETLHYFVRRYRPLPYYDRHVNYCEVIPTLGLV
jgi:hypothetical protein